MGKGSPKKNHRRWLVLPLALLVLELVNDVVLYKLETVANIHLRVAIILVVLGAGFALVGVYLAPAVERWLDRVLRTSGRAAGWTGILIVAALMTGGLYYLFFQIHVHGEASVLPESWRNPPAQAAREAPLVQGRSGSLPGIDPPRYFPAETQEGK